MIFRLVWLKNYLRCFTSADPGVRPVLISQLSGGRPRNLILFQIGLRTLA